LTAAPPAAGPAADLPPLRAVVERDGLLARKSLGQHFLFDLNLTRRIAAAAGDLTRGTTIEVGPGPGGLTRALLAAGAEDLVVVERDPRFVPALEEIAARHPGRLTIMLADALEISAGTLGAPPRRIVANLPYNVGTRLLLGWLRSPIEFASLTVMLQKEVVERIVAPPGSEAYGRLSVAAQWQWRARRAFDVPASAFVPPPQVVSSVVSLVPRAEPLAPADPRWLERVTAAAFGQRRKMLRGALRGLGGDTLACLARAGLDPQARAETLTIEQFCALARAYAEGPTDPRAAT
jgi:16S rRNA (adenine1518-N6/adenine1519-N6)-dimethyltransferase